MLPPSRRRRRHHANAAKIIGLRLSRGRSRPQVDIGSSAVAAGVVRLCGGYAKALVVDISFVIEGKEVAELPESVLGTIQICHVDVSKGRPLPP